MAYDTYSGHKRLLRSGIDLVPQLNACISFILNVTILAEYGDRMKGSRNSLGSVIFFKPTPWKKRRARVIHTLFCYQFLLNIGSTLCPRMCRCIHTGNVFLSVFQFYQYASVNNILLSEKRKRVSTRMCLMMRPFLFFSQNFSICVVSFLKRVTSGCNDLLKCLILFYLFCLGQTG